MQDLVRALSIAATNAVVVYGTVRANLGLAEALALYWFEGLIATVLVLHLIIRHRALTRKRGHFYPDSLYAKQRTATIAALGAALLLCGFAFALPGQSNLFTTAALQDLLVVLAAVLAFQVIPYVTDGLGIRSRSFGWITGRAQSRSGENLIILLSIAAGTAVYAVVPLGIAGLIAIAAVKSVLEFVILAATINPRKLDDKPPNLLRWLSRNKTEEERRADFEEWAAIRRRAVAAVDAGEQVLTDDEFRRALAR